MWPAPAAHAPRDGSAHAPTGAARSASSLANNARPPCRPAAGARMRAPEHHKAPRLDRATATVV